MNQNEITLMYDAAQMAERREQRRYEIAKDCMTALISTGSEESGWWTPSLAAKEAVEHADALLAELENTNRPAFGPSFPSGRAELNPLAHEQTR